MNLIDEVLRLDAEATKGPWWDARNWFQSRHAKLSRNGNWRAKIGRRVRDTWMLLICAPLNGDKWGSTELGGIPPATKAWDEYADAHGPGNLVDEFDFHHVASMRWSNYKGTHWTTPLVDKDAELITTYRTAAPKLARALQKAFDLLRSYRDRRTEFERLTGESDRTVDRCEHAMNICRQQRVDKILAEIERELST